MKTDKQTQRRCNTLRKIIDGCEKGKTWIRSLDPEFRNEMNAKYDELQKKCEAELASLK